MIAVLRTHQFDKGAYQNEPGIEAFIKNSMACVCICNMTKYKFVYICMYIFTNCEFEKLLRMVLKVSVIVQN